MLAHQIYINIATPGPKNNPLAATSAASTVFFSFFLGLSSSKYYTHVRHTVHGYILQVCGTGPGPYPSLYVQTFGVLLMWKVDAQVKLFPASLHVCITPHHVAGQQHWQLRRP